MKINPPAVFPREIWFVEIKGVYETKDRPCLVLSVHGELARVIYGQSSPGQGDHCELLPESREGERFKLTKPTYFRATNIVHVDRVKFRRRINACPHDCFQMFLEFVESVDASASVQPVLPVEAAAAPPQEPASSSPSTPSLDASKAN